MPMPDAQEDLPSFQDIFRDAPCGLLVTTVDGMIVRANDTFCRWVGAEAIDLVQKRRFQDLLTIGGRVFHQTHCAPLLKMQRSVAELKLDLQHGAGHIVPVLINASRLRHGDAEFDQFAMLVVTERHKYERELLLARKSAEEALAVRRDAQQALQDQDDRKTIFLATLAHELRNPLAPMRNVLDLLAARELEDPQLQWAHGMFERQLKQMTHLVDDLLEVSRISQGKLALRSEHLELGAIIEGVADASRPALAGAGHAFIVRAPAEPIWLDADPTRLAQMIQNLLNNACKYTPAGGKIWLTAGLIDCQIQISVRDSGIGIEESHLTTIFEAFSQLSPALERSQGGLGIGLSLVRSLAELHGGTVSASSPGPGLGSEFVIRLPMPVAEIDLPPVADTMPERIVGHRRVLVVDDNEDSAISLSMVLEIDGHTVQTAFSASAAVELNASFDADVLILDIGLPDMSGYDLARMLRQRPGRVAITLIALTGWGQPSDKDLAKEAGFDFHFTKPVDLDTLRAAVVAASVVAERPDVLRGSSDDS